MWVLCYSQTCGITVLSMFIKPSGDAFTINWLLPKLFNANINRTELFLIEFISVNFNVNCLRILGNRRLFRGNDAKTVFNEWSLWSTRDCLTLETFPLIYFVHMHGNLFFSLLNWFKWWRFKIIWLFSCVFFLYFLCYLKGEF